MGFLPGSVVAGSAERAAGLIAPIVKAGYHCWTSSKERLSENQCATIDKFKTDYSEIFRKEVPFFIGYVPDGSSGGYPICRLNKNAYKNRIVIKINQPSIFSDESNQVAQTCAGIIKMKFDAKTTGLNRVNPAVHYKFDITHQAFDLIMNFAINELPLLAENEALTKVTLENWIALIDKLVGYTELKYGRTSTKDSARKVALQKIQGCLNDCVVKVDIAIQRKSTTEKIQSIIKYTDAITSNLLYALCYTKKYDKTKYSFDFSKIRKGVVPEHMFGNSFVDNIVNVLQSKDIAEIRPADFMVMVKGSFPRYIHNILVKDETKKDNILSLINNIFSELSRINKLKTSLEETKTIADHAGSLWLFGNEYGKKRIQALIQAVEKSNERVKTYLITYQRIFTSLRQSAVNDLYTISSDDHYAYEQAMTYVKQSRCAVDVRMQETGKVKKSVEAWTIGLQAQNEKMKAHIQLWSSAIDNALNCYEIPSLGGGTIDWAPAIIPKALTNKKLIDTKTIKKHLGRWYKAYGDRASVIQAREVSLPGGDEIKLPENIATDVDSRAGFFSFSGRSIRNNYFKGKCELLARFSEGFAYFEILHKQKIAGIKDIESIDYARLDKLLTDYMLESNQAKTRGGRLWKIFYRRTKSFFNTWSTLLNGRISLFDSTIKQYLSKVTGFIKELQKAKYTESRLEEYCRCQKVLTQMQESGLFGKSKGMTGLVANFSRWLKEGRQSTASISESLELSFDSQLISKAVEERSLLAQRADHLLEFSAKVLLQLNEAEIEGSNAALDSGASSSSSSMNFGQ